MPSSVPVAFTHAGATLVAQGHGDPDAAETVVLLHGIGMGRTVFAELVEILDGRYRIIAIDLPGYGEAPEPERTLTMERTADLVAAYLRHAAAGPVTVLGHSMGTQVTVELAARHAPLVRRVVLVAPTVDRRHRRAGSQLASLVIDLLNESPKVLLLGAREYLRAGPHLRRKLRAMLAHEPERTYPRVGAPTLVIRGDQDRVCPARWCAEVAGLLPDARAVVIPGHGHETLIRDAAPAAKAIIAFAG